MTPVRLFPDARRPLVFAHRGASSLAPENTPASFKMARDMGCPGIELDIHRCGTGEVVVFHDDDLSRLAGSPAKIRETPLAELKRFDIGSWKDAKFSGERIPTLDELFAAFGRSVYYDVEIKQRTRDRTGIEKELSDLIDRHSLSDRVCVSSFNPFPLVYFKEIRPDVPTGIIWTDSPELPWSLRWGAGAWLSACDFLKPDRKVLSKPGILWLGEGRKRDVIPWTVDESALAQVLAERKMAGIITNRPQDMKAFYS